VASTEFFVAKVKGDTAMPRLAPMLFLALLIAADDSVAQQKVEMRSITAKVKLEEVISGHLTELNSKFKLRATELTIQPGGYLGPHHHVGPGIRFVASGKLTFTQAGKATIYEAGGYFYETGNIIHTAENKTTSPLRIIFFEILPAEWTGPSLIPPKAN
jgi:quercetin dioxygenase-like cupin family protein